MEAQGDLFDVVVGGLRHPFTAEEDAASRRPPYPSPPALVPVRARVVRELVERLPAEGDGPPVVERVLGRVATYRDAVRLLARADAFFVLADAVCALVAGGALSVAQAEQLVRDSMVPGHSGLPRQIVLVHLAHGRLAEADAAAAAAPREAWRAHRDVAAHLAERGDVDGFLARWRRYDAAKDRDEMDRLREHLVASVGTRDGWAAGVAVTEDRRIGPRARRAAFRALAEAGAVDELAALFGGPAAGLLDGPDELAVLVAAVIRATPQPTTHDHPALGAIVDRLVAIDPTADKRTMRHRDALLARLWPVIGEESTLARVRAVVRTPALRRELTRLAREV